MSTSTTATVRWDQLIEADRVHGSLYTEPAIYEAELERIWYRTWVYVGHESEIPEPNDYVLKSIGPQPVIMTRDRQGDIHLLLNRCSHRANLVCDAPQGNSSAFRCPYHGWTFANTGALLGYPFSSGYGGPELQSELGPAHPPPAESHPEFRRLGEPLRWFGTTPDRLPDYVARMRAAYGDAAEQILIDGSPHVMIFPNLFIAEIQIFVLQPTAVDETVQHVTAIGFAGAPDLSRRMLQQTLGSVGPAGLLLADDSEMYERNQRGVEVRRPEWLVLKRGLHRERIDERGHVVGDATDEVPMRAIW